MQREISAKSEAAIIAAFLHHFERDMSNSRLHMAKVRFSPLTEGLAQAVLELEVDHPAVKMVMEGV